MDIELPCIIQYVKYRNDDGFAILNCILNTHSEKYNQKLEQIVEEKLTLGKFHDTFTVTVGGLKMNEKIEGRQCIFIGQFAQHKKYGKQFKAEFFYQDQPCTESGLLAYLITLPNIKGVRSKEIIRKFGVDGTIEILSNEPERLVEINGLTEDRIPPIKAKWDEEAKRRELYIWLGKHDIATKIGQKIYDAWGLNSIDLLKENPYILTDVRGVGFLMADGIAHKILEEVPLTHRLKACIIYVLTEFVYKDSNLCIPYSDLKKKVLSELDQCDQSRGVKSQIDLYLENIPKILRNNLEDFTLVRKDKKPYIYLTKVWRKEKFIASSLCKRDEGKSVFSCDDEDIEEAEDDIGKLANRYVALDDSQKQAIKSAFNNKVTLITGPGGTGKSTICRGIYHLANCKGLSVRMMSPTGKAAQVLSNKTRGEAMTIHRSLKMTPNDDVGEEKIFEDIVIVDEVSMVGIDTLYPIMDAVETNDRCNIVFVGDMNQLPSVAPGNFLSDIIESGSARIVCLDKIHRQDEDSYIPIIANSIARGELMDIPEHASDIKWHEITNEKFEGKFTKHVEKFVKNNDIDDLQVLSPKYKGTCGVDNINSIMQKIMYQKNGTEGSRLKIKFQEFYKKDRVIQLKNNYDKNIFNGDMGTIVDLGRKIMNPLKSDDVENFIVVDFYGRLVTYIGKDIEELKLAWCCTVHKYQGSQSPHVLFVLSNEARIMAYKELVYTALTRAEKFVDIYGDIHVYRGSPNKSVVRKRYTSFNEVVLEARDGVKLLEVFGS